MDHLIAVHTVFHQEKLFEAVAEWYDIGTPLRSKFVCNGLNDTYSVDTDRGTYILRIYKHGWRTESAIRFELDLLMHLQHQDIPVSAPIMRRDGEWLTKLQAPEGTRYAVLFTFAEGAGKVDPSTSRLYGKSVALLHRAADRFTSEHARFSLDVHHLLEEPISHIVPAIQHREEDMAFLQETAERLKSRLAAMGDGAHEWGVCHGDLHGWNVFYTAADDLTHFDFDCCGTGWRAYDLAVFLWCRMEGRTREEEFKDESWDAFLAAYTEERPMNAADLEAIPMFVAIRQIWLMGLHLSFRSVWGAWQDDGYFDGKFKFLRAWVQAHSL